jgi:fructokinase
MKAERTITLLYGLILFDIIEGRKYIGGPAINIALHMAYRQCPSSLISCVGNDELGRMAKKYLVDNHVDIGFVNADMEHETGWVKVRLDENGNPTFDIIRPVAFDYISLTDQQIQKLAENEYDIFYFGTVVQRNLTSAETLRKLLNTLNYRETFFDINLRKGNYTKEVVDYSLSKTDILKLNEEELQLVAELLHANKKSEKDLVDWIFRNYPPHIILLTRGANGATVYTPDTREDIPSIKVSVKDTVGSGDAFSAGFIMEYIKSGNLLRAAQKGNELGAYVATRSGAVPELDE